MIRIAITAAAFDAKAATLPGSVGFEPEPDANGWLLIWLEQSAVNRLRALPGPGESFSGVILHSVEAESQRSGRRWRAGTNLVDRALISSISD
jgi:hypothetical protein